MSRKGVFISYSHKDERWRKRLRPHLQMLEQVGLIDLWDDRKIDPGGAWFEQIRTSMSRAAVAVCLISADYLASPFCTKEEIPYLLRRQATEGMLLILVLCRQCAWGAVPWLRERLLLPGDGKSIASGYPRDPDRIFSQVAEQIAKHLDGFVRPPRPVYWPKPQHVDIARLQASDADLFGRQAKIELLDDIWEQNQIRLAMLTGWSGAGKTSLVRYWLNQMAADNYRGADRVYGWTFDHQGTTDQLCGFNEFMTCALSWFGDHDPIQGSPWDRACRLMKLMRGRRLLLILDGIEPLQSSLAQEHGEIADPTLAAFLRLFVRSGNGACVITTRLPVAGLDPEIGRIQRIDLENIPPASGRALMRVHDIQGSDAELEAAAIELGCEALAVNLLIGYLCAMAEHAIARVFEIPDVDPGDAEGRHARRVIAAIARRLGEGPEVQLMKVLGLFDRPAEGSELACLRAQPKIAGLTDHLCRLDDIGWRRVVNSLRALRLIAPAAEGVPERLETHPIVRDYFAARLRNDQPSSWLAGNLRVYQHLRDDTPKFPRTLSEMMPLYRAVVHGCRAGVGEEALEDVYVARILRGDSYYGNARLGAIGPNLYAMRAFFDRPWTLTRQSLCEPARRVVIREAGVNLLSLGQLREAVELFQASFDLCELRGEWENAARELDHLADMHLKLGRLDRALTLGERCLRLAETSGSGFRRMRARALLANVYQHIGKPVEAGRYFDEALEVQRQTEPEHPFLISSWGYWRFDFLMAQNRLGDAEEQAQKLHGWNEKSGTSLLAESLKEIALGRLQSVQTKCDAPESTDHLRKAVDLLKTAHHYDVLPVALLALADRCEFMGSLDLSAQAIEEAEEIANRSRMRLLQADCLVVRARLHIRSGHASEASRSLRDAFDICVATGYGRCRQQVDESCRRFGFPQPITHRGEPPA